MSEPPLKYTRMLDRLGAARCLDKQQFEEAEDALRQPLLQAQFDLAETQSPVIILIGGLEGSGKGSLTHRLNEWMDPRGIETEGFWMHSDEEESRPWFWRFWRRLPPRGQISLMIGGWYNRPVYARMNRRLARKKIARLCSTINSFEQMHSVDGTLIIKIWLNVGPEFQRLQLAEEAPGKQQNPRVPVMVDHDQIGHEKQLQAALHVLRQTDTDDCPWHIVDAEDRNYRDITVARLILERMSRHAQQLAASQTAAEQPRRPQHPLPPLQASSALAEVDLGQSLDKAAYREQLEEYQRKLQDLAWRSPAERGSLVAVFEGWDAAGKGSAIRRVTGAIDPRLYRVVQFAAPSDEERAHHYLWRFWRRLERDGRATLFDRSWYGRVLVERVEGFASCAEWQRAYEEINEFERQLVEHGSTVLKFWIHISPDIQLQRFRDREREPRKQYKITDEDWRNREKWPQYREAVDEMIARTSTDNAPWTLVAGNDKRFARVHILKTFCDALAR